jgi:serine protease Do
VPDLCDDVTVMCALDLDWRRAAYLVLAAGLVFLVCAGPERATASLNPALPEAEESQSAAHVGSPAAPKPATASRKDLPAAFTRTAPASIADLKVMEQRIKTLVRQVSPAVVAVAVGLDSGSGVIISADGLVLTAGHVCGGPHRDARFTFPDGKTVRGKTLGIDEDGDTGLMRITDPGPWPYAAIGDLEQARIGDWVLALGHPGGFDPRRSLVVRFGRLIRLSPGTLQTDCTISLGDSGGPLFDMHGGVIGIHNAISSSMVDNFHVPINKYYETWAELVAGDTEKRGPSAYAGAIGVDDPEGCRLVRIDKNSPASKAGLKVGDVVYEINSRDIKVSAAFQRWIAEAQPGETLNLAVKRGDNTLSLSLKLGPARSQN